MLIGVLLTSCKSGEKLVQTDTVYVNKVEYITDRVIDSVYIDRYHTIYQSGDTVYKYDSVVDYRYKYINDTIFKNDTIYSTKTNTETKEVNHLTKCQSRQIVGFWVLLLSVLGLAGYYIYKKLKL